MRAAWLWILICFLPPTPLHAAAVANGTRAWPGAEVPYRIDSDLLQKAGATVHDCTGWRKWPEKAQASKACKAMADWHLATGIRFVVSKRLDALNISGGRSTDATLGYLPIGNRIHIEPGASYGAVLHEFGHVLGLMHEHQRQDRDSYIQLEPFLRDNLAQCGLKLTAVCNDVRISFPTVQAQMTTVYDPCSLMHYLENQTPRHREDPRWRHIFTLTQRGNAALQTCRTQFTGLAARCNKVGQKCVISYNDAVLVRRFHKL